MNRKRVILLGATGSIGTSTLDVITDFPEHFEIVGLSAHSRVDELLQIQKRHPDARTALTGNVETVNGIDFCGEDSAVRLVEEVEADVVVNGIMGSAGLKPSAAAIETGKNLALANKETIVMAGDILLARAAEKNIHIIPVDSEHAAIFQLMHNRPEKNIQDIILTASGGAFRNAPLETLKNATVEEALKHPTWDMGVKITIDSATMANKGLEVIEAQRFFNIPTENIRVLIHPQSYVHSLIRTIDGIMYAQVSTPDMKNPIINALSYPAMLKSNFAPLDLAGKSIEFSDPDPARYPMLDHAFNASKAGASYPTAFNAANEIAVDAFIRGKLTYLQIAETVGKALESDWSSNPSALDDVYSIDAEVRALTRSLIG